MPSPCQIRRCSSYGRSHSVAYSTGVDVSVRQLPSGSFQARLMLEGRQHAATFDTVEEAEEWEEITRAQKVLGILPGRVRVGDYAVRWMETYATAASSTRENHDGNLRRYILPIIGRRSLAQVTPTDIATLLNGVQQRVSAAKAEHVYKTLSAMFNAAEQDDLILRVPTRPKKHRPRRQKAPHVVFERPEARRMLLQLRGWHRDAAVLQLALGARFGEIAGLTPHDIIGRRVHIRRRVARGTVRATKNHRARTLELPRMALAIVDRLTAEAGGPPPVPDLDDKEWPAEPFRRRWLIQTRTGGPAHLSAFDKALKRACVAAEVPRLSSHGLRHTYVSWMIDDGHTADKIAFWIGDTPATVRAVYAHMLEASSAPAAASIDAALGEMA